MNIPKEAIEKAIEGGWNPVGSNALSVYEAVDPLRPQEIALDPTFWQALGKNLGYDADSTKIWNSTWVRQSFKTEKQLVLSDDWQNMALDFHDLILQEKDPTAFWDEILTK